ncbi:unnamed protein product [Staurois parvus]|uniref:Uncharacterized protein n=1 Tax=Staurois parvus TaxID=386267 RepID=A0ABN9CBI3_9NEOB|nr:unnamed protein product [Staurois parvus]
MKSEASDNTILEKCGEDLHAESARDTDLHAKQDKSQNKKWNLQSTSQ